MPIHHLVIIGCMPPDRRSPLVEQVLSQWPESERPRTPYWSLEQVAQNPSVLADYTYMMGGLVFSADGTRLISSGEDGLLITWGVRP